MRKSLAALVAVGLIPISSPAGVIVVGNYSAERIHLVIAVPNQPTRNHVVPPYQVLPIDLTGPATLSLTVGGTLETIHVEPYHAYVAIPKPGGGLSVEQLEMPGQPPERDLRPELNPRPRQPVKVPVVLLVDDADPRAEAVWQADTRKRLTEANTVLESQTGFSLDFVGYDTWKSLPNSNDFQEQLTRFENSVKPKAGVVAIGFTSRKLDVTGGFGVTRGLGAAHVLIREWYPKSEPERVEVLLHYVARLLGAVTSPDPGSIMREKLGDGQAVRPGYVIRLDPLNALALNLWADVRRGGMTELATIPQVDRHRLTRVYGALARAYPQDPRPNDYLALLEKAGFPPDEPLVRPEPAPRSYNEAKRLAIARSVLQAIIHRLETYAAEQRLTGDALTAELFRTAVQTALQYDGPEQIGGFLLGLGIGLDDTNRLRDNPLLSATVREIESDSDRNRRLKYLANPTMRNRRDFRQYFAVGCVEGQLLGVVVAENSAVSESLFDLHRPAGLSLSCLAAEFSGIALGKKLLDQPMLLKQLGTRLTPGALLPELAGLRDGIGIDRFEQDFGQPNDHRFRGVLENIHNRVNK